MDPKPSKGLPSADITRAEMVVIKVLYDAGHPMSMMDVRDIIEESRGIDWKPQTVSTLLKRLEMKGFTRMWREGRVFMHETLIPYEDFTAGLSDDLINTWFDGSVAKFFDNFTKNVRPLNKDEVNKLFGPFLGHDIV